MVEAGAGALAKETPATSALPPPRRLRVREVSSRFMSPVVSSSSTGDLHLTANKSKHFISTSMEIQSGSQEMGPLHENVSETIRSMETPFGSSVCRAVLDGQRRQRPSLKLFKENGDPFRSKACSSTNQLSSTRPDTPMLNMVDRRLRVGTPKSISESSNNVKVAGPATTAAAKLLQSSVMSNRNLNLDNKATSGASDHPSSSLNDDSNREDHDKFAQRPSGKNLSSSLLIQAAELPSSTSEAEGDALPKLSTTLPSEKTCGRGGHVVGGCDSSKASPSPFPRSLSCQQSLLKTIERPVSVLSKRHTNSTNLPPLPLFTKTGTDAQRNGRKIFSSHQEDVHSLKLLHNRYLQWRYSNAKSDAAMCTQRKETERMVISCWVKISDLQDSIKAKHIELQNLRRTISLFTILKSQMPYLDKWFAFEEDYSNSLVGAIKVLVETSLQLPIIGNVKAEIGEVGEALNAAVKIMEMISCHVQSFMPKAAEIDNLTSELARVAGGERALIEDCGDMLSKTCASQVEECSLRGQLIQLHKNIFEFGAD